MPASERTPLLMGPSSNGGPSKLPHPAAPPSASGPSPAAPSHPSSLYSQANALISSIGGDPSSATSPITPALIWTPSHPRISLAVHLYALHLLQPRRGHDSPARSIRARIAREEEAVRVRWEVLERCERILDREVGEGRVEMGGEGEIGEDRDETDEQLVEALWGRWPIREPEGKWISAIDLMLPPFVPEERAFPLLSHPVVRHVLDLTWYGSPAFHTGSSGRGIWDCIRGNLTPARLHALHLASLLVLFSLTLAVAISPGARLTPYDSEIPKVTTVEVVWMIWAGSDLLHTIRYPTPLLRRLSLLPTQLAFVLSLTPGPSPLAYTFLTLSIFFLTFLLILPAAPSFPVLLPELLPLSVLLRRVLYRSARTVGLMMPLVAVVFGAFAWSMNGDIYRGLFTSPSVALIPAVNDTTDPNKPDPANLLPEVSSPDPIEPGIAPFQARLSLFLTLTFLLLFSGILAASRSLAPSREDDRWDPSDSKRCRGAVKEGDRWEREWGLGVGREARRAWGVGVREYYAGGKGRGIGRERERGVTEGREGAETGEVGEVQPWLPGRSILWLRWPPPFIVLVAPFQTVYWIMTQCRKNAQSQG